GIAHVDLTMMAVEQRGAISISLEYSTDLFDARTIDRMLANFRELLEGIVADPSRRFSEISIISRAEREGLLGEAETSSADAVDLLLLPQLFAAGAVREPDSIAASCDGRDLTYRELDARSSLLANHLTRLGVGPDVLVGLCVERSLDMLVGLLGILKAGGAYV